MIRFSLICKGDHEFDGWFASSEDYEKQRKRGLIACPACNSTKVEKSLMAPSVSSGRKKDAMVVAKVDKQRAEIMSKLKEMRDTITAASEDVGKRFPEEARKIHYGESEQRGIYGEAKRDEVESLLEEGIEVAPLPVLPEDAN